MRLELEPAHRAFRDTLRRFGEKEMTPALADAWDREVRFPRDVFARLADLGAMGVAVPEEHGGTGTDIVAAVVAVEELSRRSLAVAVPYIMAVFYAGLNVLASGSAAQRRALLPEVAAGRLLFAYGLTEPDVGADLARVTTTAVRDGDHLVVSGVKRFCSGAEIADYICALVRTDPEAGRHRGLSLVLIPPRAPGVTIRPFDTMGMHGVRTNDVVLDGVRVPQESVLGGPEGLNQGWGQLMHSVLGVENLEVAAMALGIAEGAHAAAWAYSQERVQFGQAICRFQAVRHALADMATRLRACRLTLYDAAWRAQAGDAYGVESAMTKLFVTETAKEVVLAGQTLMGAYGYVREHEMERYVRDILLMPIIGGSSAIQRNNISNRLGLPR